MVRTSIRAAAQLLGNIAVAVLFVSAPMRVSAQNRNAGEIRGTITDSSGGRVPGVIITITNIDTGVATRIVGDRSGVYEAPSLEPGNYTVTSTAPGFKTYVREGVVLHVEAITVDAVLQVGAMSQQVTVEAATPLVQTESSQREATITGKTISELPNVGRSWTDVTGLLPGVNPGASGVGGTSNNNGQDASGAGVGVNGSGSYQINFLTDGGVTTLPVSQNLGVTVPIDAIAEVDMSTSNFSAEYGNGVAVFNAITKSGANQFHGSAYEFVQNDKLEARNFFAPTVTPLRWNEYGGTIGGPIRRDKAFSSLAFKATPTIPSRPTTIPSPQPQ